MNQVNTLTQNTKNPLEYIHPFASSLQNGPDFERFRLQFYANSISVLTMDATRPSYPISYQMSRYM
jgi:hypothetical protein